VLLTVCDSNLLAGFVYFNARPTANQRAPHECAIKRRAEVRTQGAGPSVAVGGQPSTSISSNGTSARSLLAAARLSAWGKTGSGSQAHAGGGGCVGPSRWLASAVWERFALFLSLPADQVPISKTGVPNKWVLWEQDVCALVAERSKSNAEPSVRDGAAADAPLSLSSPLPRRACSCGTTC